ncbi:hypothetical protein CBR_g40820 [Chara braunii]|uniref:Uncharacterized protein n=1 Tax=Chara braunii TaxID=69332 RepID=A0A388LUL3_CHABU|nr:hypothetical protein CBR_g40820 [Chara braunii]|eukprot:GBG86007.1 hypothetical protein CBR_g40820 [Chara braunii]
MLRCTFCNKVFQGTQFYATKHFTQQNYCKKVSDDALYQIAQKCTHRFEANQVERVRRFAHERGLDVPRSGAMGGEAERPAQGVGEGEDTERYAEGGVARYGEGAGAAEEDEADVDLEVGMAEGERTPRGEGGVPKSDPMARQRTVDRERRCGKKPVPPETACTSSFSKSAVPDRACTLGSSKRKERGAHLSATNAGKRLRQQKIMDTYGGEWIGQWRKAFFRWVYSSGIALNAFRNTLYRDLQQVAFRQPGGAPLPVLTSHSEIASMLAVEIHREELAEELEEVRQPLWDRLRDPIGSSAPPLVESVFGAHATIFGVLPSEVEREDDVVRTQVEREEGMAGVDDGDAQVEIEEDVVRADAAVLVGGEEGVVGGGVAHGRREGGDDLDPIIQRFVDDEMGPTLAGLTPGTRRALGASPSGQRGVSGLGMGDFMDMSLGDPPNPSHTQREDMARALAAAGYSTEEIEQAFAGRSGRETDTLQQGCEEVVEQPQEEHEDAPAADIPGGRSSLVPFTGLQMTTTMRPVRPCVQGSGPGEVASVQVPPLIVVDFGSESALHTPVTGRRARQDTARPLDFAELARAALRDVTRQEDTDHSRPLMPPPPPRSLHSDSPSTPVGRPPPSPSMPTRPKVRDMTAVGSLPLDMSLFGSTDIDLDSMRRVTVHTARQQPGLGGDDTGRGAPREVMAAVSQPRHVCGVGEGGCTLQAALAAAAHAVHDQTSRRSGVARPRLMPAAVGASLEESSEAEGLGMARGSRREKTVAEVTQVSARLVRVRTGADPVTVVEDDPETEPEREEAPQEGDEYRDDEEREEEESDSGDDDSYHDDDEPSPPPRYGSRKRRGSRRRHDDVDDPSPPGRREARSQRRRGSSVATAPGRGSVSSTCNTSGERQRDSGKGKGGRRY